MQCKLLLLHIAFLPFKRLNLLMEEQNVLSGSSFGFFWFKSQTYRGSEGGSGGCTDPSCRSNKPVSYRDCGRTDRR